MRTIAVRAELKIMREIKPHSFIFEQQEALPKPLCQQIIQRFEQAQDEQYNGRIGQKVEWHDAIKKSTDIFISGKEHWNDIDQALLESLGLALQDLRRAYPYFRGRFKDLGYGLQRTREKEYYHWHVDGGSHEFSQRQLVAIWYLNTLKETDGGSTQFKSQDIHIQPQCGKLILFPPFWTHEHRGKTLKKGVKYIATTWLVFA